MACEAPAESFPLNDDVQNTHLPSSICNALSYHAPDVLLRIVCDLKSSILGPEAARKMVLQLRRDAFTSVLLFLSEHPYQPRLLAANPPTRKHDLRILHVSSGK